MNTANRLEVSRRKEFLGNACLKKAKRLTIATVLYLTREPGSTFTCTEEQYEPTLRGGVMRPDLATPLGLRSAPTAPVQVIACGRVAN